jgi:hypothetical protein
VLYLDPSLPVWLPDVHLRALHVGQSTVDLRVWREGTATRWDADVATGTLEVQRRAWRPW